MSATHEEILDDAICDALMLLRTTNPKKRQRAVRDIRRALDGYVASIPDEDLDYDALGQLMGINDLAAAQGPNRIVGWTCPHMTVTTVGVTLIGQPTFWCGCSMSPIYSNDRTAAPA